MEASYASLYHALGKPVSDHSDIAYRRIRWQCGCVATGRNSEKMFLKTCLRHSRHLYTNTPWHR